MPSQVDRLSSDNPLTKQKITTFPQRLLKNHIFIRIQMNLLT